MTKEEFCKIDTKFYGEVVDNIKQIKQRSFNGEELKEYVEHCIRLNLLNKPIPKGGYSDWYNRGFEAGLSHRTLKCKCGKN